MTIWIDEPAPGNFHWIMATRIQPGMWEDLVDSQQGFPTWIDAWNAGTLALLKLLDEEAGGPGTSDKASAN